MDYFFTVGNVQLWLYSCKTTPKQDLLKRQSLKAFGTFKIFQNTDSAYTRVLTGSYNIYTDNEAGSVIRGIYDYQQGYWASRYVIKDLTESRMCWVALDDETNVCVYVRADIPKDIYSAYVPDVKEEEK